MRARALAVILGLGLSLWIAPGVAADSGSLDREAFSGTVTASAAVGERSISTPPSGNLTPPPDATRLEVTVTWNRSPNTDIHLVLRNETCEGPCDPGGIAQATGEERASITIPVDGSDSLHWQVDAVNGTVTDEPFRGQATWTQTPTSGDPPPSKSAQQATPAPAEEPTNPTPGPLEAAGLAAGLAGLLLALSARLRRWATGVLLGLFHRIRDHELLNDPTREALYEAARDEPGIHYEALRSTLELSRGSLEHHLERMLDADLLVEEHLHGYRCLFVAGHVPEDERQALALLRSQGAQQIAEHLDRAGVGVRDLARETGLAASTVSHHVDKFRQAGLVRETDEGSGTSLALSELGARVVDRLGLADG